MASISRSIIRIVELSVIVLECLPLSDLVNISLFMDNTSVEHFSIYGQHFLFLLSMIQTYSS